MTIRFLKQWNGYSPDAIVTLAGAEETRLVNLGFASFDLDGDAEAEFFVKGKTNPLTGEIESFDVNGIPQIALGVTIDQRDTMGRVSQYTVGGVQFSVTYGPFGVSSITGGGMTRTISYNAAGQITEVSNAAN